MNLPNVYAFARMAAQGNLRPIASGIHPLERGQWIICRSSFGLELAEILSNTQAYPDAIPDSDTTDDSLAHWVRDASSQDHWIWSKIQDVNQQAIQACQAFLSEQQCNDTILDIATSIDGKSVAFEFLGQASEQASLQIGPLTEIYQNFVRNSSVYKQIEEGCGPGCGTSKSCGSSTDGKKGCASCSVASRCKKP